MSYDSGAVAAALVEFYAHRETPDPYLDGKSALASGRRELAEAYGKVRFALAGAVDVLDWGCRHGVFAWLARADLGPQAQLHGCDLCAPEQYGAFHAATGLHYRQLAHPWRLPYDDASFDAVIGGGTLEHVPNDGESLTELWRVLRPGGRLLLTHVPNAASASEWLSRRFYPANAHPRRYRPAWLRAQLLHKGFMPTAWGYHQFMPASLPKAQARPRLARALERLYALNGPLERLWPLNRLSATFWLVAEKRTGF